MIPNTLSLKGDFRASVSFVKSQTCPRRPYTKWKHLGECLEVRLPFAAHCCVPHPRSHSVTCPWGDSPETLLSIPAGQTWSLGSSWIKQGAERISPCWRALGAALSTFCRALKIAAPRGGQGETGEADSSRTPSRLLRLAFHGDVSPGARQP